jgi:hypothetical protein
MPLEFPWGLGASCISSTLTHLILNSTKIGTHGNWMWALLHLPSLRYFEAASHPKPTKVTHDSSEVAILFPMPDAASAHLFSTMLLARAQLPARCLHVVYSGRCTSTVSAAGTFFSQMCGNANCLVPLRRLQEFESLALGTAQVTWQWRE